ncbi:MAG: MFS transporter [Bacteroidota bacterium]
MNEGMSEFSLSKKNRIFGIIALILSGESMFFLPFVIQRVFRGTYLEVFEITNTELGFYFSAYGIIALFSYISGGPLADRFSPSKLISFSLAITALSGFFLYVEPTKFVLRILYIFWGFSTLLLFWSPLLRTTRILAGNRQGRGFGLLEGGRGMISALVSYFAVDIFIRFAGGSMDELEAEERTMAFKNVILFFSSFTLSVAVFAYFSLKPIDKIEYDRKSNLNWDKVKYLLKMPAIWLQALIIICAYSGYKVSDYFNTVAQEFLGYSEQEASRFTSLALWIRPLSAIVFGLIADYIRPSKMIMFCFFLLAVGGLSLSYNVFNLNIYYFILFTVSSVAIAVYALRGLYFSVMKEGSIPLVVTGTAIGLASLIGYLPDIFMGPVSGYIVDANPGEHGLQNLFLFVSILAVLGFLVTFVFRRMTRTHSNTKHSVIP